MLSVNNITMRFGPRVLFENVTCNLMAGRRYAVTGPNGAGKSTFMKILTGEIDSTSGSITRPKKMGVCGRISLRLTNTASSTRSLWGMSRCGRRSKNAMHSMRNRTTN